MELGNIAQFKTEYLKGYPLVNIKEKHFHIKEGYKLSAVVFNRPKGNEKNASAQIWLISNFGDVIKETLNLEFAKSEKERINFALKPSSFKIRQEALELAKPRSWVIEDVVTKYEDLLVKKIWAIKNKEKKVWTIKLVVYFINEINKEHIVSFEVDFTNKNNLTNLSLTGTIELNIKSIKDKKIITPTEKVVYTKDFTINESIINGSPPQVPSKNIIIPKEHIKIIKLDYIPPESVDDHEAALKVEYLMRETEQVVSKWINLNFKNTIREAARLLINSLETTQIRYLVDERKTPPVSLSAADFHYVGLIPGIKIADVIYNYNEIQENQRFIDVTLILEYKTMFFKVKKVIEFLWSKHEYIDGSFRAIKHENDSVTINEDFLSSLVLKQIFDGDKVLHSKLLNNLKINENYPYSSIVDVNISRFIDDSNLVILAFKAHEKKGKDLIVHNFEKHIIIPKSYNEERLEKLKGDDIEINYDLLPLMPSINISEQIFNIPEWCFFESMQYGKPNFESKEMVVQLKLKAGSATVLINKRIAFEMSIKEFKLQEEALWEQDFLNNLDPRDITINLDLSGHPVEKIAKSDVEGIPQGIKIDIDYQKPPQGKKQTRLFLRLSKGPAKVTFEQTLSFAKEAI